MKKINQQNYQLSTDDIKRIAKLANLTLDENELAKFPEQLSAILAYVEILKEVDTKNIEPTSQVTLLENASREDKAKESLTQKEALSGSKEIHSNLFKIKRILPGE
jgi:aspartyl-tRNA(Asn)/glutamyl-tRNA(Gln) amidotransferase subunit C